jgi:hypothetical protein
MAKLPSERRAAALKANLKRRKQKTAAAPGSNPAKDPEKPKGNGEGVPLAGGRRDRQA